jgi:hypothetical protein
MAVNYPVSPGVASSKQAITTDAIFGNDQPAATAVCTANRKASSGSGDKPQDPLGVLSGPIRPSHPGWRPRLAWTGFLVR